MVHKPLAPCQTCHFIRSHFNINIDKLQINYNNTADAVALKEEERSIVRIFANITKHKKPDIQGIIIVMVIKGALNVKYFYNGMVV